MTMNNGDPFARRTSDNWWHQGDLYRTEQRGSVTGTGSGRRVTVRGAAYGVQRGTDPDQRQGGGDQPAERCPGHREPAAGHRWPGRSVAGRWPVGGWPAGGWPAPGGVGRVVPVGVGLGDPTTTVMVSALLTASAGAASDLVSSWAADLPVP
jgi:hypothetical protein